MTQNLILAKLAAVVTLLGMVIMIATKTDSENTLTASPTVGVAPLEVAFTGYGSGMSEGVMVLDFGDGQKDNSISTIRDFARKHTYAVAGSYKAELKSGAYGGQRPSILKVVGTVIITVR